MSTTSTTTAKSKAGKAARAGKSPEERVAEVEALAAELTAAVATLTGSAAWVRMLRVAARFHRYSANNVLLLWMQAEQRGVTLTRVAGYRAWQGMGRQVVKGARSLGVLAPVRRRLSVEEATQRAAAGQRPAFDADGRAALVVRGFRIERVFRIEDTEGEPLPEAPELGTVDGDTPTGTWEMLADLVYRHGYRLTGEFEHDGARGHTDFTTRTVNIDPVHPLPERVHVLIHELAHIRCEHGQRRDVSRAQRETEAESVAFIVCTAMGLHVGDVSAVYVGGWTDGDPDTIAAAQAHIHQAARSLLADLDPAPSHDKAETTSGAA